MSTGSANDKILDDFLFNIVKCFDCLLDIIFRNLSLKTTLHLVINIGKKIIALMHSIKSKQEIRKVIKDMTVEKFSIYMSIRNARSKCNQHQYLSKKTRSIDEKTKT